MHHGVVVPSAHEPEIVGLIRLAEESGWDGAFSWESVWGHHAWVALGAAAAVTERIRLGTLLTPAPRWRPWDLATAVASVDRLSAGRAILGVGLGALHGNWLAFEPDEGRAVRARRLDEVLDVYAGLMAGQPFTYAGEFFTVREVTELVPPPPVQTPHPPVWCVGAYAPDRSRQRSLERAARWQGVFPATVGWGPELRPDAGVPHRDRRPAARSAGGGRPAVGGLRRRRRGRQLRRIRHGRRTGRTRGSARAPRGGSSRGGTSWASPTEWPRSVAASRPALAADPTDDGRRAPVGDPPHVVLGLGDGLSPRPRRRA